MPHHAPPNRRALRVARTPTAQGLNAADATRRRREEEVEDSKERIRQPPCSFPGHTSPSGVVTHVARLACYRVGSPAERAPGFLSRTAFLRGCARAMRHAFEGASGGRPSRSCRTARERVHAAGCRVRRRSTAGFCTRTLGAARRLGISAAVVLPLLDISQRKSWSARRHQSAHPKVLSRRLTKARPPHTDLPSPSANVPPAVRPEPGTFRTFVQSLQTPERAPPWQKAEVVCRFASLDDRARARHRLSLRPMMMLHGIRKRHIDGVPGP